jgi:hypothetical protein
MTFVCLVILPIIVPFPPEILFEFLATKFLLSVLTIVELQAKVMCPRGTFDDSLLRVHHVFLPGVSRISSQNIWHSCGGSIAIAITCLQGEM